MARQSYDWLCNALEVYRPQQSEYGRLEMQGTVLSKRRLKMLVESQHVSGWDDPRLYTVIALRRRGVPPGAILSFISQLGVTTSRAIIPVSRFEQSIRQYLEHASPRLNLVLNPIKLVIENLPDDHVEFVEKPLHPKIPEMGTVRVPFTNTIYIDASDFKEQDEKGYFRLAPGKAVGLLNAPAPVLCNSFEKDPDTGKITLIRCIMQFPSQEGEKPKKPKGWIHWIAEHNESASPVKIDETRIFHRLFKSEDPTQIKETDKFIADLNKDSLEVVEGALVDIGFWEVARKLLGDSRKEARKRIEEKQKSPEANGPAAAPAAKLEDMVANEAVRFQGNRTAYFALDSDSILKDLVDVDRETDKEFVFQKREGDRLVINRIVSLKEDAAKK